MTLGRNQKIGLAIGSIAAAGGLIPYVVEASQLLLGDLKPLEVATLLAEAGARLGEHMLGASKWTAGIILGASAAIKATKKAPTA